MIYYLSISLSIFHSDIIFEIKANFKTKNDSNVLSLSYWKNDEAINKNKLKEINLGRKKRDHGLYFEHVQFA